MIKRYLNQDATWKCKTGQDGYGQPIFDVGTAIKVRWQGKRQLIRDTQGQEVVSQAEVWLLEDAAPEDHLVYAGQEYPIVSVGETVDLEGNVRFRKVFV